jgi:hypothetical protein
MPLLLTSTERGEPATVPFVVELAAAVAGELAGKLAEPLIEAVGSTLVETLIGFPWLAGLDDAALSIFRPSSTSSVLVVDWRARCRSGKSERRSGKAGLNGKLSQLNAPALSDKFAKSLRHDCDQKPTRPLQQM